MAEEFTLEVPARYGEPLEVMVDMNLETSTPEDVYTYASDLADMPLVLKRIGWHVEQNPVFVHADDAGAAWEYVRQHKLA